jgi:hypothetical protein
MIELLTKAFSHFFFVRYRMLIPRNIVSGPVTELYTLNTPFFMQLGDSHQYTQQDAMLTTPGECSP